VQEFDALRSNVGEPILASVHADGGGA